MKQVHHGKLAAQPERSERPVDGNRQELSQADRVRASLLRCPGARTTGPAPQR